MNYKVRLFREPGDDGGTGLMSLEELMDPEKTAGMSAEAIAAAQQEVISKEATNTDGSLKPGYVKSAEGIISKDENYKAPVEGADDNGEPLPGYKKDDNGAIVKDPDYKAPVEGLDDKGELLPGYKKDDDGNVIKDEDYVPDPIEEAKLFFTAVAAITGDELEITYPPEITDPLSPEGVAFRDGVIREDAANKFEQYLQHKDPRSYAYMLHREAGGSDDDFMNGTKGFVLPVKEDFDPSVDIQSAVLKHDLRSKGLDETSIELLVKQAITDNKLKEKAEQSYKLIDDAQKKQLDDLAKSQVLREQHADTAIKGILDAVDASIKDGMKFIVSEADRPAFKKFITDNMRYNESDGTFALVQSITPESLSSVIESLFFQHKKGDLKALVAKQVKTEAVQSIRLRMQGADKQKQKGRELPGNKAEFLPLDSINVT